MSQVRPEYQIVFADGDLEVAIRKRGETLEWSRRPPRGGERLAMIVMFIVMLTVTAAGVAVAIVGAVKALGQPSRGELFVSLAVSAVFMLGAALPGSACVAIARSVFATRVCLTRHVHGILIEDYLCGCRWRARTVSEPKAVELYLDKASRGYRFCLALRGSRRRWYWLVLPIDPGSLEACKRHGSRMAKALGELLDLPVGRSDGFRGRHSAPRN